MIDETERAAMRALRREDHLQSVAEECRVRFWPSWTLRAVKQRICQQTNPHYGHAPVQARVLRMILRETGDEELFGLLSDDFEEGQARRAEREAKRLREAREMRTVRPQRRGREVA